jgi:4-amino-4-deoxy-L-arabinose transferase-like glycosyltransferase
MFMDDIRAFCRFRKHAKPIAIRKGWIEPVCAIGFAFARTAVCAWRAAHQSIVHDEAFSFLRFIHGPWSSLWSGWYDAANHVLYSFLAKLSVAVFGLSDFSLRLPSVVAGFFFIWGVFRVLESCESRLIRWIAYLAIGLHPLLMDFSIAARGYGLGIALLVWAIHASLHGRPIRGGFLLGFAIAANLTMVFPATGLIAAHFLLAEKNRIRDTAIMGGVAAALATAICYFPFRTATRANFYVGGHSLSDFVFSMILTSISASQQTGLFGTRTAALFMTTWIVPAFALFWVAIWAGQWQSGGASSRMLKVPLTLAVTVAFLLAAHFLFKVNYPADRTGLYLVPLAGFTWAATTDILRNRSLRAINVVLACVVLIQFVTQAQFRSFQIWSYNSAIKDIAQKVRQESRGRPAQSLSLATNFYQQPVLEFYRIRYGIAALKPVQRKEHADLTGHDFYVLTGPETHTAQAAQLTVLFSDPVSDVVLAR